MNCRCDVIAVGRGESLTLAQETPMDELVKTREDRVLRLTLNRAEQNNLLTPTLVRELVAALAGASVDREVGCVLLDASGPMFCGGLDLQELAGAGADGICEAHGALFSIGMEYSKPVVAAVHGPCLGAGVGLAANAHVILAAQGVKFGLTEVRYGFWPFAAHRALVLAMGERRVTELSLTGRIFGAQEALQYGLVQEIAPAFELDDRATVMARHLASCSPEAVRRGLEFVRRCRTVDGDQAAALAADMGRQGAASADFAEGIRAMREARRPEWPALES